MGSWAVGQAPQKGGDGVLVGGVEGAALVPLHVTDAAHRLHLGLGGPEVTAVLVVTLLQQVLQPAVARVLVADPSAGPYHPEHILSHLKAPSSCATLHLSCHVTVF